MDDLDACHIADLIDPLKESLPWDSARTGRQQRDQLAQDIVSCNNRPCACKELSRKIRHFLIIRLVVKYWFSSARCINKNRRLRISTASSHASAHSSAHSHDCLYQQNCHRWQECVGSKLPVRCNSHGARQDQDNLPQMRHKIPRKGLVSLAAEQSAQAAFAVFDPWLPTPMRRSPLLVSASADARTLRAIDTHRRVAQ